MAIKIFLPSLQLGEKVLCVNNYCITPVLHRRDYLSSRHQYRHCCFRCTLFFYRWFYLQFSGSLMIFIGALRRLTDRLLCWLILSYDAIALRHLLGEFDAIWFVASVCRNSNCHQVRIFNASMDFVIRILTDFWTGVIRSCSKLAFMRFLAEAHAERMATTNSKEQSSRNSWSPGFGRQKCFRKDSYLTAKSKIRMSSSVSPVTLRGGPGWFSEYWYAPVLFFFKDVASSRRHPVRHWPHR